MRHREAAERTLLTAIGAGLSPAALADALLAAGTERAYADTGHSLDFVNKAFECLDLIGWDQATAVLPTVVGQMVEELPGVTPTILLHCATKQKGNWRTYFVLARVRTAGPNT